MKKQKAFFFFLLFKFSFCSLLARLGLCVWVKYQVLEDIISVKIYCFLLSHLYLGTLKFAWVFVLLWQKFLGEIFLKEKLHLHKKL